MQILTENTCKTPIPKNLNIKTTEMLHEHILHFGTDKLYYYIKKNMIMKNAFREARETAASCIKCQKTKYYNRSSEGRQYFNLPTDINQMVSVDIFGSLPASTFGHKYVIATTDIFSKAISLFPSKRITAKAIANIIEKKYLSTNEPPTIMVSDGGKQFDSSCWEQLCKKYRCISRLTSPHNHQSNPIERFMKELGRVLRANCANKHSSWEKWLKPATMGEMAKTCYNSLVHKSTKIAPAKLQKNKDILQLPFSLGAKYQNNGQEKIEIQKIFQNLIKSALERNKRHQSKRKPVSYKIGQQVLKKVHKLSNKFKKQARKLFNIYDGPFEIKSIPHENSYTLTDKGKILGNYNARQLRPLRERKIINIHSCPKGKNTPSICLAIGNKKFTAILDTGASCSAISEKIVHQLIFYKAKDMKISKYKTSIQGISGKATKNNYKI